MSAEVGSCGCGSNDYSWLHLKIYSLPLSEASHFCLTFCISADVASSSSSCSPAEDKHFAHLASSKTFLNFKFDKEAIMRCFDFWRGKPSSRSNFRLQRRFYSSTVQTKLWMRSSLSYLVVANTHIKGKVSQTSACTETGSWLFAFVAPLFRLLNICVGKAFFSPDRTLLSSSLQETRHDQKSGLFKWPRTKEGQNIEHLKKKKDFIPTLGDNKELNKKVW